jgi:adenylosuccinate synthase
MQGVTEIAVTKMDVLSYMEKIPVCTHYRVGGKVTDQFPFPAALDSAEPVIEWADGWACDISAARRWEDLPIQAREYIERIEQAAGCPAAYISVGPERDSIIIR